MMNPQTNSSGSISELNRETEGEKSWQQRNYDDLLAEIHALEQQLHRHLSESPKSSPLHRTEKRSLMLDNLCQLFGLSLFERQLLLLCVAMELGAEMQSLCMQLVQQPSPCLALALMCFEGHCTALAPDAPLRYFELIELKRGGHPAGHSFVYQSLALNDWALFYLTGAPILAPELAACLHPVALSEPVLPTHVNNAERLHRSRQHSTDEATVVQLLSTSVDDRRQVGALLAQQEALQIYDFNLCQLPLRADEQRHFLSLLEREVIARQCLLLIDCERLIAGNETGQDSHAIRNGLDCLIRDLPNGCILSASQQLELPRTKIHYQTIPALPAEEQLQLWQHCLQDNATEDLQPTLEQLTVQYNLTARQVRSITHSAALEKREGIDNLTKNLWKHSREQSRQNLNGLANVISPSQLDWDNLILPKKEKNVLCSLVAQVQQRQRVYQQWGFANQVPYGLGIGALFAGGSGTGKTMAARIIASLLNLDLYHVELSNVVDKYIGETEKKLDQIFSAAENSGAILLFDEADALFGKRSKVQDARDRYANIGVSFLLQRMESYSGLSILTTNMRSAMDSAFTRRLRFIVQFPFPGASEREQIWRRTLPAAAPKVDIDYQKLAHLTLAGGAIRNIALQAAFIAAEQEQGINMHHLREAVRQEYLKAEKALDERLVQDW